MSGGADSVALLQVLLALRAEWKLTLHVAHVDHGLRPDSAQDAEFVRELGAREQLPTTIARRDVPALCARGGWSLEEGARRIRYQVLSEIAARQHAGHLALAHTADDQAETVLMRLMRGAGLLGLSAIPMTRELDGGVRIVRPVLQVWRREIIDLLKQRGLAHREDATNTDTRFLRNRVRHELLPLLERDYNPNIKAALTQLAEQSRVDYTYLQQAAGRQWKRLVKSAPPNGRPGVAISIKAFLRQPKALQRQLVRQAIQRVRGEPGQVEFRHWTEVEQLFLERPVGTLVDLPGEVQLRRDRERVICLPAPRSARQAGRQAPS